MEEGLRGKPSNEGHLGDDGVNYYLKQEILAAKEAVSNLDKAVSKATSFREKSSLTLEEAHRALSRLQQALEKEKASDLVAVACEIKVATRTALTLVEVYGSKGAIGKMASMVIRKQIHAKFDAVTERLRQFFPSQTGGSGVESSLKGGRPLQPQTSKSLAKDSNRSLVSRSIGGYAFNQVSQPPMGQLIREDKHGKHGRIYCICYAPASSMNFYCVCLWWSAGQQLEFYSESSESTTAFEMRDLTLIVTSLAVDSDGHVWTGHMKGLVRVKKKQHWELVIESQVATTPIRCIVFDEKGQAWVGDDAGQLRVLRFDEDSSSLETVHGLVRRRSLEEKQPEKAGAGSAKTAGSTKAWYSKSTLPGPGVNKGPARCIYVHGNRAWIGGGRNEGWLTLWDTTSFMQLDFWEAPTFGPCNTMSPIHWGQKSSMPQPASSMPQPGANLPAAYKTMSDGVTTVGAPRPSQNNSSSRTGGSWRLMTGHENGQVLLWQPGSDRLLPLLRIGDPTAAIRGMAVFEDYNLVVVAHSNGEMALTVRRGMEPPGSESASAQSFGIFRPRRVMVRAHKSNCALMVGYDNTCVTASNLGTIRLWQAKDLVLEAERQGLLTDRGSERSTSGSRQLGTQSPRRLSLTSSMKADPMAIQGLTREGSVKRSLSHNNLMSPRSPNQAQPGADAKDGEKPRNTSDSGLGPGASASTDASGGVSSSTVSSMSNTFNFSGGCQMIEKEELDLQKLIGAGAYGKVWLAEWTDCQVAVKELLLFGGGGANSSDQARAWQEMQNEVHLLGAFSHPNIMRFLAVCVDPPMIVMQYYPHGSLFDLLTRARKGNARAIRELSWSKRLSMLRDVAAGMHYLHTRKPSVIHGDLRSPNLLLDLTIDKDKPRFHVKIADFGLARMLNQTGSVVKVSKTTNPRWSAPEVIQSSQIGPAADVYSFAIIMWEMMTWAQPYEDMMSVQVIFSSAQHNCRPDIPPDNELPGSPGVTLEMYKEVMKRCWSPKVSDRPNFKQIVELFTQMRALEDKEAPPPKSKGSKSTRERTAPPSSAGPSTVVAEPIIEDLGKPMTKSVTLPELSGAGGVHTGDTIPEDRPVGVPFYESENPDSAPPLEAYNPFGAAAGAAFDEPAPSNDPFGAAAGAPFDDDEPFDTASGVVTDTAEAAEYNPFGAAAGAAFGDDNEQTEAEYNPFGAAAGAAFDDSPAPENNPFGAAAGSPFDNNPENNPFGAASHAADENNPFGAAAGVPFDSPENNPLHSTAAGAGFGFDDQHNSNGSSRSLGAEKSTASDPARPALMGGSENNSNVALGAMESVRSNSSPVKMNAGMDEEPEYSSPFGEAAMAPFHAFLVNAAQQPSGARAVFAASNEDSATSFESKYPFIAAAGTSIVPEQYRTNTQPTEVHQSLLGRGSVPQTSSPYPHSEAAMPSSSSLDHTASNLDTVHAQASPCTLSGCWDDPNSASDPHEAEEHPEHAMVIRMSASGKEYVDPISTPTVTRGLAGRGAGPSALPQLNARASNGQSSSSPAGTSSSRLRATTATRPASAIAGKTSSPTTAHDSPGRAFGRTVAPTATGATRSITSTTYASNSKTSLSTRSAGYGSNSRVSALAGGTARSMEIPDSTSPSGTANSSPRGAPLGQGAVRGTVASMSRTPVSQSTKAGTAATAAARPFASARPATTTAGTTERGLAPRPGFITSTRPATATGTAAARGTASATKKPSH